MTRGLVRGAAAMAAGALIATGISALAQQQDRKAKIDVLFEQEAELPSNKVKVVVKRAMLPAGYKSPEHTHKGPGVRYVFQGTLRIDEKDYTGDFSAGQVYWESGHPMTAETISAEDAEILIVELQPAG
jgi:quercetin dioxygenase-like cupin family protein